MRILVIAPNPFFVERGFSVRVYHQVMGLKKLGHEVLITAYNSGREIDGIEIKRTPGIPGYNKEALGAKFSRLYLDLFLFFTSCIAVLQFKPDIIHGHLHEGGLIGIFLKKIFNIPVVLDAQGSLTQQLQERDRLRSRFVLKIMKYLENYIHRKVDFIITSTVGIKNFFIKELKVPEEKIEPILDCVDLGMFSKENKNRYLRKDFGLPENKKIVIYIGTLHWYYGIDCLLQAIKLIKEKTNDIFFIICGGPNVEKYLKIAKELGIDDITRFFGRTLYSDISKYLSMSDICVAPKIGDSEGNQKILVYMAYGLPIVCFRTSVNQEILGEYGIYADLGSSESLAEKIIFLVKNEEFVKKLKNILPELAMRNFSVEKISQQLVGVYKMLLYKDGIHKM